MFFDLIKYPHLSASFVKCSVTGEFYILCNLKISISLVGGSIGLVYGV